MSNVQTVQDAYALAAEMAQLDDEAKAMVQGYLAGMIDAGRLRTKSEKKTKETEE